MAFQSYLNNIKAKSGHTPEEFHAMLVEEGRMGPDFKAKDLILWLKERFDLGHGHSMAVWTVFMDEGWVPDPKKKG